MGSTMSSATSPSDLSTDPRAAEDRRRAQNPLGYPGPSIFGIGLDTGTLIAAIAASLLAITLAIWLAGRGRKKPRVSVAPAVNPAELTAELAPVALKVMQSPAIRAYLARMLIRSITRKVTG